MNKKISIIIPTKDREAILNKTLEAALLAIKNFDAEIIIVNDSKSSVPQILADNNTVKLINNNKKGVASARNLGVSVANGEWILFLDDDMLLYQENIQSYLAYTNNLEKICVNIEWEYPPELIIEIQKNAFGRFLIEHGFTSMRGWNNYPKWEKNSSVLVDSVASPNLFLNKKFFLETGGYDESFPFAGFEDYAFSKRLARHNFKMFVDTTSLMYHNEEDRVNSPDWYKRKERGGETRKIAVKNGFKEVEIKHNLYKKIFYGLSPLTQPILQFTVFFTSSYKVMDSFSFFCYKLLLGISTFKGYNKP